MDLITVAIVFGAVIGANVLTIYLCSRGTLARWLVAAVKRVKKELEANP